MKTKAQKIFETILAASVAAGLGCIVAIYTNKPQSFTVFARIPNTQEYTITPTPSAVKPRIISQISQDGIKKIVMTTIQNTDTTETYYVSVTDTSGVNGPTIFTKTLDPTKTLALPFNAWSPDNQYFFIQEQADNGRITDIFALNANGKPFVDGETFLDVTQTFINRNTGNIFAEATGWASETLIIINTMTQENKKGPSYWFEVPSKAIIQLSTEF